MRAPGRAERSFGAACGCHRCLHVLRHAADVADADVAGVALCDMGADLIVVQRANGAAGQLDDPVIGRLAGPVDVPLGNLGDLLKDVQHFGRRFVR